MGLFRKALKDGKQIELPASGAELRQEMAKVAKEERFAAQGSSLLEKNSSALLRGVFEKEGLTWDDAKRALDPNIWTRSVEQMFTNTNTKPLFPIITEDYVRNGYEKAGRASELIMGNVPMEQQTQEFYYYEDSDDDKDSNLDFNLVAQGAPIPVTTIGLQDKRSIRVYKRGGGVEITDEAKSMKIDMLAAFLKRRGQRMGITDERLAIETLSNGYFEDGWDAPEVIGVSKVNELDPVDMWYATYYMNDEYGFTPDRVVMNLKTAELWLKNVTQAGNPLFLGNILNGDMPNVIKSAPFINKKMPDGKIMFVDTGFALQEYTYKPFSTETERSAKTQLEGSYSTKTAGYVPFEKRARLIVDITKARA